MHFNALLLSLAAPVATAAAQAVVETTQTIGQSFAEVFAGSESVTPEADSPDEQPPSSLEKLVGGLRKWLQAAGIPDAPFELRYHLDPGGQASLDVSGVDAGAIEQMLAADPNWHDELRRSAVEIQKNAEIPGGQVPPVTLSITERDWSISASGYRN